MSKAAYCGLLRRDPSGRWYYGEQLIGIDGEPLPGALEEAMAEASEAPEPDLPDGPRTRAVQTTFTWPVEAPMVAVDQDQSLAQAHRKVWAELDAGTFCPCCQRTARRYARRFHAEMATFLVRLVRAFEAEKRYYHLREILPGGAESPKASTDGSYLTAWRLVKRQPGSTGRYIPTPAGIAFVRGLTVVPRIAWVYDGHATHFSQELISIRQALEDNVRVLEMLCDRAGPGVAR